MSKTNQPNAMAIIPARGGSKGIRLKNLREIGGKSLLGRAIESARSAAAVSDVVVSTDHEQIKAEALRYGARVIDRPADIAGDTASSESVLLHALANAESQPEITVFIQCTSPFIDPEDLDAAIAAVSSKRADVSFAAVADHGFHWGLDPQGEAVAVGHDKLHRPRRQDREPRFRETGAFYVMDTRGFREAGHRFFGKVRVHEVPAEHGIDIDTEADLLLAGLAVPATREPIEVDAVITDFDGVHTPDTAYVDEHGTETVRVSRSDGMGVARLRAAGVKFLILSKEINPVVAARAAKLNVEVAHGIDNKAEYLARWLADESINPARVAYVGNDINDLGAMALVGWPITVADAQEDVHRAARYKLTRKGGHGAVRELAELVLAARTATKSSPSFTH
ncbi:N-acylneuraminate cytidylyltransferase [Arthrobacter sp. JUb119]|uniref:acylneuraminate cytidylyltransferase n=1 Tax=Micrococcaceae TaxID=1268 RepID=UPI000CFABB70|nr:MULTISPECIES: acylneuraminate cytidylyltransferase [unclassified Arthrobacter]MCS3493876.1 N-acylneuraminate cytidylyltransferase [Arthrobacter sp. JUb119]PQZ89829.1 acylneuraminate cytidylyltransferase [Arthrobacter sp. MYb222]PRB75136.1 acylneuraminate cytidylyltransferase [Arthrobacter sp. MYb214]